MKIRKMLIVLLFTLTLSITTFSVMAFGAVPYKTLYYDGATHTYTNEKLYLNINGTILEDDKLPIQPIIIDDGITLVPLREVFENLGARVNYDSKNNAVTIIDGDNTVLLNVDSTTGYINGEAVEIGTKPKYVSLNKDSDKKIMIPVRFVGEGLGYKVAYDGKTKVISINKDNNTSSITPTTPTTPVNKINATKVEFTKSGDADLFLIYGEETPPNVNVIADLNGQKLYIDIVRPNLILNNKENNQINETVTGNIVSNYKIYDLNDDTTRVEITLNNECFYNVVQNGKVTKVYIKAVEPIKPSITDEDSSGTTDTIENTENTGNIEFIDVKSSPNEVKVYISKTLAKVPNGYKLENIKHTDDCLSNRYYITLPFSIGQELPITDFEVESDILKSIEIVSQSDKTTFVFNGKNVLYVDVTQDSNNIIFTIKFAKDMYDKIIVIDAGHGGKVPGAVRTVNGKTYYEKDLAYDMAMKTASFISKDPRFKVYLSRPKDEDVDFYDRSALSTRLDADMFISIHVNAADAITANGIETLYFDIAKEDKAYLTSKGITNIEERRVVTTESKLFAQEMQKNLIEGTLLTDRKAKHSNLAVLRSNEVPAILVETGFISNYRDAQQLIDEGYRTKVAKIIADTVIGYYSKY